MGVRNWRTARSIEAFDPVNRAILDEFLDRPVDLYRRFDAMRPDIT